MKKLIVGMLVACLVVGGTPLQAQAKKSVSLSKTKVSMDQKQSITLKLRNTSSKAKVTWNSSDRKIVRIVSKGKKSAKIKGLASGKATISVTYKLKGKRKVMKCKVTVREKKITSDDTGELEQTTKEGGEDQKTENVSDPNLNATCAAIYYSSSGYKDYIVMEKGHDTQFQFKAENTNKKVIEWKMIGENAKQFTVSENGTVSGLYAPLYDIEGNLRVVEGTVQATLSDGTKLQAKVFLADEVASYLYSLFEEFRVVYLTDGMTELDKVKAIGKYIGECSDYDKDIHDWQALLIQGKGDCQASRYVVQYMCQYFGIRAGALRSIDIHGQTLVLADGKYYIVTTGYNMVRPRAYNVSEITEKYANELMEKGEVIRGYFETL